MTQTTAIALFERFQPRFRELTWKPLGFRIEGNSPRLYFRPEGKSTYSYYDHPYLDLQEFGLTFTMTYTPESEQSPAVQLLYAGWNAVMAGPFAGRTFYADPAPGAAQEAFRAIIEEKPGGTIPVTFSHSGAPIPGLCLELAKPIAASWWGFFIPEGTPEFMAAKTALALEKVQYQERKRSENTHERPSIEQLQARLADTLATVTA